MFSTKIGGKFSYSFDENLKLKAEDIEVIVERENLMELYYALLDTQSKYSGVYQKGRVYFSVHDLGKTYLIMVSDLEGLLYGLAEIEPIKLYRFMAEVWSNRKYKKPFAKKVEELIKAKMDKAKELFKEWR